MRTPRLFFKRIAALTSAPPRERLADIDDDDLRRWLAISSSGRNKPASQRVLAFSAEVMAAAYRAAEAR
jgi:hypothetical protein